MVFTTNLCGGTCDHCGTAISNVFRFEGSDGTRFKVGSVCVDKAAKVLGSAARADRAIEKAKSEARNAAKAGRHAREAAKIEEAEAWITDHRDELASCPHPRGFEGQSLIDSINWMWGNAGVSGKLRTYKAARIALAA